MQSAKRPQDIVHERGDGFDGLLDRTAILDLDESKGVAAQLNAVFAWELTPLVVQAQANERASNRRLDRLALFRRDHGHR